jgi:hypothetical protein
MTIASLFEKSFHSGILTKMYLSKVCAILCVCLIGTLKAQSSNNGPYFSIIASEGATQFCTDLLGITTVTSTLTSNSTSTIVSFLSVTDTVTTTKNKTDTTYIATTTVSDTSTVSGGTKTQTVST